MPEESILFSKEWEIDPKDKAQSFSYFLKVL